MCARCNRPPLMRAPRPGRDAPPRAAQSSRATTDTSIVNTSVDMNGNG
ncbi:hypothetical protein BLA24064_06148 [Burkholderia latens]|uniref:Uncharacterized protein n=1 Tax=Burkholderia latens TaxID=488446 RepID=A0A6P2R5I1_9BURK|nr:hypothetical protein BLA24064_06148 [Burkholderia latens]